MRHNRLDTEELIQNCRSNYEFSKYQSKIKELETALQLKSKENQYLTTQIISIKNESSTRSLLLQKQLTDIKRQYANLKVSNVKQKRSDSQRYEKIIENIRKQYEKKYQEKQFQFKTSAEELSKRHHQDINRLKQSHEQQLNLKNNQLQSFKNLVEQKYSNYGLQVVRLEDQKINLIKTKREADQKTEEFKQGYQKIKGQFKQALAEKDEELSKLKGEVQGLKLQQKLLNERLQETRNKQSNSHSNLTQNYEDLKHLCLKLSQQNEKYKQIIMKKDDQILKYFKKLNDESYERVSIKNIQECNHLSLISKMQKNIQIKQKEILNLKAVIEEWSQAIGFDKSVSLRLSQISDKSMSARKLNTNLVQSLIHQTKKKPHNFRS